MNFYRRRPLALAISLCMIVSAAAAYLPGTVKLLLMGAIMLSVPIIITILRRRGIHEICNLASAPFVILCGALMAVFLLTAYGYYEAYAGKYESIETGSIRAVVTEVKHQTTYNATYVVKLESLDGETSAAEGLVSTEDALSLSVGDVIETRADFVPLEEYYSVYDVSRIEMLSDGYVFACKTADTPKTVGIRHTFSTFFAELRDTLHAKMSLYLNDDSSALADALFLGERDGLGRIRRDFSAIGVIHILALSGMHIAILVGGFDRILRTLGIGAKLRYIILMLAMAFYVALTGFLVSILRAAIMMAIVFLAELIDADADRVTSLFIACGIIILVSPASVYDASLQLSFFATLGMTLFSEAVSRRRSEQPVGVVGRHLRTLLESVAVSFGAALFILPLQWFYFGEISLICIPATLIMSFVCEGLLVLIPVCLVFSLAGWHFICGRLGFVIGLLTELCSKTAQVLADLVEPVSLSYPFVPALLVCFVSVIVYMMYKNCRSWLYALVPAVTFFAVFLGCVGIYEHTNRSTATLDYVNYLSHDAMLLVSNRNAMIVDVTDGSRVPLAKLETELRDKCLTTVDALFLTDLSRKHISSVRSFIQFIPVKRIYAPIPVGEYDRHLADDMYETAEEYGAELMMYPRGENVDITFGDVTVSIPSVEYINRSVKPLETVKFSHGGSSVSYIGAASWENSRIRDFAEEADCLIFGNNGPAFKTPPSGTVPENVSMIHVPSLEYGYMLGEYMRGFDGAISHGEKYSIAFD